ncbi:rho GTPase-activating protein gacZ [Drosophila willistoni]|uniref:rho GTPase-activating protein gacZ n=1 Tax=Drosophila willistoni TaxID=7260 RepID=UPI00017D92DD|nr:rho GTPase-activating protein gacZ [Drosophila willistoni]
MNNDEEQLQLSSNNNIAIDSLYDDICPGSQQSQQSLSMPLESTSESEMMPPEISPTAAEADSENAPVAEEKPIRVRDMINLYNFATKKNQELAQAKSIYFSSNNNSNNNNNNNINNNNKLISIGVKNDLEQQECCDSICCNMETMDEQAKMAMSSGRFNSATGNFRVTTTDGKTSLRQSIDAGGCDGLNGSGGAVEKSYQSKTTIRRTDQGVRIIIDIFFDKKDADIEIVGSRVETDIPESRILADFQQHSLAMQQKQQEDEQKLHHPINIVQD